MVSLSYTDEFSATTILTFPRGANLFSDTPQLSLNVLTKRPKGGGHALIDDLGDDIMTHILTIRFLRESDSETDWADVLDFLQTKSAKGAQDITYTDNHAVARTVRIVDSAVAFPTRGRVIPVSEELMQATLTLEEGL